MAGPIARRREIRRAFGKDALDVLNAQGEALGGLIPIVGEQKNKTQAQGEFIADMSVRLDAVSKATTSLGKQLLIFRHLSFVGRLRWLLTGQLPD